MSKKKIFGQLIHFIEQGNRTEQTLMQTIKKSSDNLYKDMEKVKFEANMKMDSMQQQLDKFENEQNDKLDDHKR